MAEVTFQHNKSYLQRHVTGHLLDDEIISSFFFRQNINAQLKSAWADPEGGGQRVQTPLKNRKNIGFLCNTGPDPLKNKKATKPAFNVGSSSAPQRNAI